MSEGPVTMTKGEESEERPMSKAQPMIELERVTKRFGPATAVDDLSMSIRRGEFFSMLGPSGCGKTTTLRMIAGFEEPTMGRVLLDAEDVTLTSPRRRNVNMVFQDYALFPHMTVAENVGFGLKLKRVAREELRTRVEEMLRIVRLEGLGERRPAELSGGQRQRVALARALVNRPAALLLDEPLGALDLKLRREMQLELKRIQKSTETTFVYVTHDQEEALTMSDRIAVMADGRVEQLADPKTLYERPETSFVADFIGTSNALRLSVDRREGELAIMEPGPGVRVVAVAADCRIGEPLQISIRPEKIRIEPGSGESRGGGNEPGTGNGAGGAGSASGLRGGMDAAGGVGAGGAGAAGGAHGGGPHSRVCGVAVERVYLGSVSQTVVELPGGERLAVHELNDDRATAITPGDQVTLSWPARHSLLIAAGTPGAPAKEEN